MINFVQRLFNLKPYKAAQKLEKDFCLPLSEETSLPVNPGIVRRVRRQSTVTDQLEASVKRIYRVYCDYLTLLNQWAQEYAPRSPDEEYHPLFVEAMYKKDYVNYLWIFFLMDQKQKKQKLLSKRERG